MQHLASRGLLGSVSTKNFNCVSCQLGKQPVLPFNTSESMSTDIFDLIHFDFWVSRPKLDTRICDHDRHANIKSKPDINKNQPNF